MRPLFLPFSVLRIPDRMRSGTSCKLAAARLYSAPHISETDLTPALRRI